jgi:NAD(P)-dependent dehydrogenase (short-subunit alcohol dehydrogenase family)
VHPGAWLSFAGFLFQSLFKPPKQQYKSNLKCNEFMSKSFLLVGGSSDIARHLASMLLDDGHHVTLLARDGVRVSELVGRGAHFVEGDALDESTVQAAVAHAAGVSEDGLSGMAHLVGSIALRPPHATKLEDFEAVIQTNLISAFLALKTAGKAMLKSGTGRMVFTSSVAGSYGLTNHEAIAAAKGGIEAMVRAAASTYAGRGLRVNAVAPGLTETRLGATVLRSDAIREASVGMIPLKRINEPDEVAASMHWLLTGAPDNLTGQVLHLDGGMSALRG